MSARAREVLAAALGLLLALVAGLSIAFAVFYRL